MAVNARNNWCGDIRSLTLSGIVLALAALGGCSSKPVAAKAPLAPDVLSHARNVIALLIVPAKLACGWK